MVVCLCFFIVRALMTLESLSNQDGDGNENGKSGDSFNLTKQQLCTSVTIHFFAVVTGLLHETSREHKTTSFLCFLNLETNSPSKFNPRNIDKVQ